MVIGFIIFCIIICLIVSAVTRKDASKSGGTNINSVPKKKAISIVGGINHFSAENFVAIIKVDTKSKKLTLFWCIMKAFRKGAKKWENS